MTIRTVQLCIISAILAIGVADSATDDNSGGYRVVRKVYEQCVTSDDPFKCFKIQALKIADRAALHTKSLTIIDGISLKESDAAAAGRSFHVPLNESKLERLDSRQIDGLIVDAVARFLGNHRLELSLPQFTSLEESRKKKEKGFNTALMWALAIKGSFLAMAYNGIAVMSGTALIVGKLALLLSAILGLKKLAGGGQEKTTFEIVKQPKHIESHSHSSSYEDEGPYRRGWELGQEYGLRAKHYRSHNGMM